MYADGLLRHFVRTNMEDVLAHVVISGFPVEGLVIALHQDFVALFKAEQQELILVETQAIYLTIRKVKGKWASTVFPQIKTRCETKATFWILVNNKKKQQQLLSIIYISIALI